MQHIVHPQATTHPPFPSSPLITQATSSVLRELLADMLVLSPTHGGTGHAIATSSLYSFLCQQAEGHHDVEQLLPVFTAFQRLLQEADTIQGPAVVQRMFVLLDSLQAKCEQDFVHGRYDESALAMQSMALWMRRLVLDAECGRAFPHLVAMVLHRMYKYSVLEERAFADGRVDNDCCGASTSSSVETTHSARSRLRQLASAAREGAASANTKARRSNAKLLAGDTTTLWRRAYADLPTPSLHTCSALLPILLAWEQEAAAMRVAARSAAKAAAAVPPCTGMRVLPSSASDITSTHHSLGTVPEEACDSDDEGGLQAPLRASARSSPRDDRSDGSSGSLEAVERAPPVRQDKGVARALHLNARVVVSYEEFKSRRV